MARNQSYQYDELLPSEKIVRVIYRLRGKNVMLDRDIAVLYGVTTKVLKQAVRRNLERFRVISCLF
jgi:hypothetical protein